LRQHRNRGLCNKHVLILLATGNAYRTDDLTVDHHRLAAAEHCHARMLRQASGAAGRVSIGTMVVATPVWLARAIALLNARSSQTTALIEEGDLKRLLPRLRMGELICWLAAWNPATPRRTSKPRRSTIKPCVSSPAQTTRLH
jgi:hypothetical protein